MLEIKGIEAGYGKKQVLFGLSINVRYSKIVALIGPNGSGKSTLLKAAFGLIPAWQGNVFLDRVDITNASCRNLVRMGISFVPQGNRVFDELSVLENLEIGGLYLAKKEIQEQLDKVWELFPELHGRKKQNASKLSGGEKQMLALGRALMPDPILLLMDEPSLGLSPKLISQMMNHLQKLNRESGKTILIVEQKVRDVLEICDHVYSIKLGRIAYSGPPEPLKTDTNKMRELFL